MKALTHGYAKRLDPKACLNTKTKNKLTKLTVVMIFVSFQDSLLE